MGPTPQGQKSRQPVATKIPLPKEHTATHRYPPLTFRGAFVSGQLKGREIKLNLV